MKKELKKRKKAIRKEMRKQGEFSFLVFLASAISGCVSYVFSPEPMFHFGLAIILFILFMWLIPRIVANVLEGK